MATLASPPPAAEAVPITPLADIVAKERLAIPAETSAFIDGAPVRGSGARIDVFYPATGEKVTTLIEAEAALVDRAVAAAKAAFETGPWPRLSVAERKAALLRVRAKLAEHVRELGALQMLETGIPLHQVVSGHCARTLDNFELFGDIAATIAGQTFQQTGTYLSVVTREPVGVAAIFAPWNAPLVLSSMKLAAALAFGNTVVLKASEFTPLTIMRMVELIHEAGIPAGVVNLVNGGGAVTGRALSEHRDVDAVGFIGSTATGKQIMTAAAQRIAKVGLELGGKSANIVTDSADIEAAVDGSLLAILAGSGQQCLAGSRILVQRGIAEAFTERFVERMEKVRLGDPYDPRTEMGPLAYVAHRDKVLGFVADAVADGGAVLAGGGPDERFERGCFVRPTVIRVSDNAVRLCQTEVFGPVASLQVFDTIDEAIRIANESELGLVGYIWSEHLPTVMKVVQGVRTGTMWVNTPLARDLRAPFGGYKLSGLGRDGREGCVDLFTEEKTTMFPTGTVPMPKLGLGG